jgi:hypothetical protein
MNKKASSSKILMGLTAVFAIVAIFVEYAPAFDEDGYSTHGSLFTVMFGNSSANLATIWPLVIAFVALLLGLIISFAGLLLDGNALKSAYLANAVLFICAGVLCLFAIQFFKAANPSLPHELNEYTTLGSGAITTSVFAFLAGASSLGGALLAKKA